jgi:hypothetical protein
MDNEFAGLSLADSPGATPSRAILEQRLRDIGLIETATPEGR